MALHTDTEIYKSTYDLSKLVTQLVANMPRNFKADFGAELRRRCRLTKQAENNELSQHATRTKATPRYVRLHG